MREERAEREGERVEPSGSLEGRRRSLGEGVGEDGNEGGTVDILASAEERFERLLVDGAVDLVMLDDGSLAINLEDLVIAVEKTVELGPFSTLIAHS